MAFQIIFGNIIEQHVDAVVNPTNVRMHPSGGTDLQIHKAAGPEFDAAVKALGRCEVGEAKITPGFNLPAKYVIHTVGPVWEYGLKNEAEKLASCYKNCLRLAEENGCESIAFPLISAGTYRFPKDQALKIAEDVIRDYLETHEMEISLVLYDPDLISLDPALEADIRAAIRESRREHEEKFAARLPEDLSDAIYMNKCECYDAVPFDEHDEDEENNEDGGGLVLPALCKECISLSDEKRISPAAAALMHSFTNEQEMELRRLLNDNTKTFSEYILALIKQKGLTETEFYKRANMSRQTFSNIRNNNCHPKKENVVMMAFSLKLTPEEADLLLEHAGYALSHSIQADIIARYFLENRVYDYVDYTVASGYVEAKPIE